MSVLRFQFARARRRVADRRVHRGAAWPISMRDLRRFGDALAAREIVSVFFGGGTPSLFAPDDDRTHHRRRRAAARAPRRARDHDGNESGHGRARPLRRIPARRRHAHQLRRAEFRRRQAAASRPHPFGRPRRSVRSSRRRMPASTTSTSISCTRCRSRRSTARSSDMERAVDIRARAYFALPADARAEHAVRRETAAAAGHGRRVGHAGGVSANARRGRLRAIRSVGVRARRPALRA